KLPLPALLPITYNVNTNYKFIETASNIFYGTSNGEYANGYNGLTTSNTFVYSYDSYELKKWDGPTGNLLSNKQINYPAGGDFSKKYWGGISADDCGNLFLGDSNIVRQYDTALTLINSYVMPGVIIDVNISSTGILYVCGLGFVSTLIPKGMVTCHPLKLTTVVTDVTCGTLGSATVNVTGGSPPYTIVWNTSPPQYGTTISNVTPGLYTVTVTENLCSKQIEVDSITIAMAGVVSVSGTPTNTCYNGTNGSITTTVSGGTGNSYQYSWTGFPTDTANFLSNLSAGTYTVSVISGSCSASSAIIVSENPVIDTFNLQTMYCRGETTAILSLSSMGMAQAPYQWYNSGNVIPGANQNEFNALVNNLDDYTLTWHYGGCEYTTSKIDSIVLPALKVATAVNVFSPDNDGINDWFFPFVELTNTVGDNYFESYTLQIFDRWGNKVFETSESDTGWNGITSKNKKADNGVYYWIATGKSNCSEIGIKVKGFVTLVR
ncbi:MAG: gliding motility-associated C-terminal domain-containing protein, partial [Bacteroidota bacterium]